MKLVIDNYYINTDIDSVIDKISLDINRKINRTYHQNNIIISCPFHKNGEEKHPSCSIYNSEDGNIVFGTFHCWSCGQSGQLYNLVNKLYNKDYDDYFGKNWLIEYCSTTLLNYIEPFPYINNNINNSNDYLDESILDLFDYSNNDCLNYLINKRHLSLDVIKYFNLGYDKDKNSVVFPVRDVNDKLVMLTKRNISNKFFEIQKSSTKPIYLLNEAIKHNYTSVIVCESQINALTCYTYGYPAIALFGTGSDYQYQILKNCGIRNFILMFDGDLPGRHGAMRFKENINKNCLINDIIMPKGKDVNDLSKEEFYALLKGVNIFE